MGRRTKARECALQMLYQWDMSGEPVEHVIQSFWRVRSTMDTTRELAERLMRGAARERAALDETITAASTNWRFERIAAVDKNILRLAAYELLRDLETPSSVVMDEAIELAKRFGEKDSPPFVNGVLDAINRKLRPYETRAKDGVTSEDDPEGKSKMGRARKVKR